MKKYLLTLVLFCSCLFSNLFGEILNSNVLPTGTYQLLGKNPGSNHVNYRGKVFIESRGSNYALKWVIGNYQVQSGTAILQDHVLSVTYYDHGTKVFGVVSYVLIGNGQLEGKWAPYGSAIFGQELLIFESSEMIP